MFSYAELHNTKLYSGIIIRGRSEEGGILLITKKCGYKYNKKIIVLLFAGILLPCILLAQEQLTFIAERDTVAFGGNAGAELIISAGEHITIGNSRLDAGTITYGQIHNDGEFHLVIFFGEHNNWYWAFAKDFRPLNTEDVFWEDIFIDYPMDRWDSDARQLFGTPVVIGNTDKMWVPLYYRDIDFHITLFSRKALFGSNINKATQLPCSCT
jgi:hypothetical protein